MLRLPMQVPVEGVFCSQWDGPVHFILLPHGHREPEVALYGWQYHTPLPPHTPLPRWGRILLLPKHGCVVGALGCKQVVLGPCAYSSLLCMGCRNQSWRSSAVDHVCQHEGDSCRLTGFGQRWSIAMLHLQARWCRRSKRAHTLRAVARVLSRRQSRRCTPRRWLLRRACTGLVAALALSCGDLDTGTDLTSD